MQFYTCKGCSAVFMEMGGESANCDRKENLELLAANTVEASKEKHIPVAKYEEGTLAVKVGGVPHPMTPEHHIAWIFVQTRSGGIYRNLSPEDKPEGCFAVKAADVLSVSAYCNLHGLWKVDISDRVDFEFNEIVCSPEFPDGCTV